MGSLYKHVSTRWIIGKGEDAKRVPPGTSGARKVKEKSKCWWAKYRNAAGEWVRECLDVKHKSNAKDELDKREKREENLKVGVQDRYLEYASLPLAEHVQHWFASLENAGASERRRKDLRERIDKVIETTGWKRLADITPDSALQVLRELGVSAQTRNHYQQHIKQFVRWCVPDRLPSNPLTKLKRVNVKTDRRHDRRALTDDEAKRLLTKTTASQLVRFGLEGESRAMLYELALATGFRRGELRSLTHESFDFDGDPATVTVCAAYSKHRSTDVQPLPKALAERLKAWIGRKRPLWSNLTQHTSKMLKADLEAAGIEYKMQGQDGPLFADFHALRHTFCTAICRTNAPIKDMLEMTRHTSADLFLKTYAKTNIRNKANVAAQLPDFRAGEPEEQRTSQGGESGCTRGCTGLCPGQSD
jgi:integrase